MTALDVREGYRLWAPTYAAENAVSWLEAQLVEAMTPPLASKRLLDAGCGTGRRMRQAGAALAVGIDLSPEMLAAGADEGPMPADTQAAVADVRRLPLPDRSFDVVWCRLVMGHLPACGQAYAELARVADNGARVIVTDFHPKAHAAGHRRTFRAENDVYELEHHVHPLKVHLAAAEESGLLPVGLREARIGPEVRPFYERAGRATLCAEHRELPVVLALAFVKGGH